MPWNWASNNMENSVLWLRMWLCELKNENLNIWNECVSFAEQFYSVNISFGMPSAETYYYSEFQKKMFFKCGLLWNVRCKLEHGSMQIFTKFGNNFICLHFTTEDSDANRILLHCTNWQIMQLSWKFTVIANKCKIKSMISTYLSLFFAFVSHRSHFIAELSFEIC